MSCGPDWAARIELVLTSRFDADEWSAVRAHLRACAECRATYDEAADAVAVLEGRPGGLASPARAHLREAILDATAGPAPRAEVRRGPWRRWWLIGSGAAAAAAVLLVFNLRSPEPLDSPPPRPAFTARGADAGDSGGFRLFCIDVSGDEPRVRASTSGGGTPVRCRLDDRLQFTYTLEATTHYLSLFAIAADGEVIWYWPREEPRPLAPGTDRPLPGSFELSVAHRAGRYTVYGVPSAAPLEREEALRAMRSESHPVQSAVLELE